MDQGERQMTDIVEPTPIAHTYGSIRAAAEEFLALLDEHDEPDPDGYFQALPKDLYFVSLHEDHPGAWDALVRNMMYGLDRFPPGRVLDIGCGHGLQSFVFARHGHAVIGLDSAEHRALVSNRIAAAAEMPWLEYITGNAREEVGKLRGSSLWMHRSFHHIPERDNFDETALRYFSRVHDSLEPGGVMVFTTSNATSRSLLPWVSQGRHKVKHLVGLIEQTGFDVRDLTYRGYLTVLPRRIRPRNSTKIDDRLDKIPGIRRLGGSFSLAAYRR
jgi:2-polyprenyl-3-methyl-5-hydroxy-6-metoxy-1,4-benzoquinol methylase